jgi:hypothetical protein
VEFLGMNPRECQVACHGVLVHIDQAACGSGSATLAEVLQDGQSLVVGQAGVFQDGAFAFGEGMLAGAAIDQADASGLAAPAAEVEIFATPDTGLGALGILATEVFDRVHAGHPCS